MKYIIMAGGKYNKFKTPKQLLKVYGEVLIERTIRLLKENGIEDIAISTDNPAFDYLDIEIIRHKNNYIHEHEKKNTVSQNTWINAYCPMNEPCCYLHGDVYYSEEAIKTIVNTKVNNTMFFAVPDIQDGRKGNNTKGREPLAYKVENQKVFRAAINELLKMVDEGKFKQDPISWNLYRQINNIPIDFDGFGNDIFNMQGDYIVIDDYSTDIDNINDIPKLESLLRKIKGGEKMIKVKVNENFTLGKFDELINVVRNDPNKNEYGSLYVNDTFECTQEMTDYLTGNNYTKRAFVEVIEVIPEKEVKEEVKEEKPKKRTTKKK